MRFASPIFLVFLLVPLWFLYRAWLRRRQPPPHHVAFGGMQFLAGLKRGPRSPWARFPQWLGWTALVVLITALARPQVAGEAEPTKVRSRNIMLVLDISSSMKATDFQPGNRLEVARMVLRDFIKRRNGDLIGMVIFAGRAFLQAPLTTDLDVLDRMVESVDIGTLPDGTAIGTALALSLNQLKNLPRNACTIVLITDGANNTGRPTPTEAAEAAKSLGIRIHAIGLSNGDTSQVALNGVWSVRNLASRLSGKDEAALKDIAARSGGQFYKANDPAGLEGILKEIDPLERIEVTVSETRQYHELFPILVGVGLSLLLLQMLLQATWLRMLP
ncbi:MAG: VWA domain-containing protein [Gemmatimonadales bacterium]